MMVRFFISIALIIYTFMHTHICVMVTMTLQCITSLVTNIFPNVKDKNHMTLIAAETDSAINNMDNKIS